MINVVLIVKNGSILMCGQWQLNLNYARSATNTNAHSAITVGVMYQNKRLKL
jgi:hypothetical protein